VGLRPSHDTDFVFTYDATRLHTKISSFSLILGVCGGGLSLFPFPLPFPLPLTLFCPYNGDLWLLMFQVYDLGYGWLASLIVSHCSWAGWSFSVVLMYCLVFIFSHCVGIPSLSF
jgi:hypothetical protein